jgi:hypothetical protein
MTFTPLFLHLILVFYIIDYVLDDRVSIPGKGEIIFPLAVVSMTSSGVHPASCIMGTGGPFPGGKAHPQRYADHSLPSSAEVVNEYELYILYLQAPPWRVAGLLYFLIELVIVALVLAEVLIPPAVWLSQYCAYI